MGKKREDIELEEENIDKSQEPFDYGRIEELVQKMLNDPEANENWKEIEERLKS